MDFGQALRQLGRSLCAWLAACLAWLRKRLHATASHASDIAAESGGPLGLLARLRGMWRAVAFLILALVIAYPLAAWWISIIDDNPDFGVAANSLKPTQSVAIANAAALIDREVNDYGWTPNDTFLWPTVLLDNMPNYQMGMLTALSHFATTLASTDPQNSDLKEAAELLQYPPDVWVWQPSASLWPASSEHKYNNAIEALTRYNAGLLTGTAHFDVRAGTLKAILARIGTDFDQASTSIDSRISNRSGFLFINNKADDVFYTSKGELYAYYILLKGTERDFAGVIKDRGLAQNWRRMMESLHAGIGLRPWFVLNAEPDSQFVPCVLCSEGFYLLRARAEMQDIANRLAK